VHEKFRGPDEGISLIARCIRSTTLLLSQQPAPQLEDAMFKTKQRSTIIRSLTTAAAALAIVAVGAPASALAVSNPLIAGGNVDFGRNWSGALSDPLNGGTARRVVDPFTGDVTIHVSGRLYMTNSANLRGRLRIQYLDAAGTPITSRTGRAQGPAVTDGMNQYNIANWAPYGDPNVDSAILSTLQETAIGSGIYQTIGSVPIP
jgi:hypothetical protein